MRELPEGWEIADLDLIARISTGKRDANHSNDNGKYVFFTCAQEPCLSNTYAFDDEAIILPGNGANVGCVYYYKGPFEAYQRTYVLHDIKIVQKYLYYQLLCEWRNATSGEQYGSATNYIKMGNFLNYKVPLPPLNEQKRIADRLDQLLTRIDKIKAHLDRIPLLLKRFRQSVLAAATSGKLTEDWRTRELENKILNEWSWKSLSDVCIKIGRCLYEV